MRRQLSLFATAVIMACTTQGAIAAETPAAPVDTSKIIYVLRQTKVIKPEDPLNATMVGRQAIIITPRKVKSTDRDCKIDAVFISKELFGAFPDQISRVRVLFSRPAGGTSSQVDVTAGDVKAFGSGAMNADSLLSSLDIAEVEAVNPSSTNSALSIVSGPMPEKRLVLLSRIDALKAKGTSVKPFRDIFDKIEAEVPSATPEQLTKDISYLADKLSEQEQLVKQAGAKPTASAPSGRYGRPMFSSDSVAVLERCREWNAKLRRWRSEGRDVDQLQAAIQVTKIILAEQTPESIQKAAATLDGMDFLFKSGPPPMK